MKKKTYLEPAVGYDDLYAETGFAASDGEVNMSDDNPWTDDTYETEL